MRITSRRRPGCRTSILSPPINDQFGWGASITSNYGLATEFNDTYAGGSVGGTTDLETMNLNLSGAYRLNEGLELRPRL